MLNKIRLLTLLCFTFICTHAQSENFSNDGKVAYIEGMMYLKGIHYPQNNQKAFDLIQKSAQSKHAKAQYQLAIFYFNGITVVKNIKTAVYWLNKSANQGHKEAQLVLDSLPEYQKNSTAINQDKSSLAIDIEAFRQEIEQSLLTQTNPLTFNSTKNTNNPPALTDDIQKLKQDIKQSIIQQESENKQPILKNVDTSSNSTTPKPTKSTPKPYTQTSNINTTAVQTIEKKPETLKTSSLSTLDNSGSLTSILSDQEKSGTAINIQSYPTDETQTSNITTAQKLLAQVIKENRHSPNNSPTDANLQFNLALQYFNGTDKIIQDYTQAYYWFYLSAKQGNAKAQFNLGNMYFKAIGVDLDYKKAYQWYKKSADQEDPSAQFNLGFMYLNGLGIEKNTNTAIDYFKKSAQSGLSKAQLSLGIIYLEGQAIKKDLNLAAKWIQRCRAQGEPQAQSIWDKYELWKYWQIES